MPQRRKNLFKITTIKISNLYVVEKIIKLLGEEAFKL